MNTMIPAGAGEKMQYIVHPFNDNTIRFVLHYPSRLQAETLRQASFALAGSVDVLHASFVADKRRAGWQINDICPEDCFTCIAAADPITTALAQALQPIEASSPAQMRCILVEGAQDCAVVLLVSHLCVDGSDGKYLLHKLCEAYHLALETGSCTGLTVKNGSRAVEQVYSHLTRQERFRLLRDPRTGIRCEFPFPAAEEGKPRVLWRHIPAREMSAARQQAKHLGATVNDLLLTACYYAYAETADIPAHTPISVMSMMDLRRHCEGGDSQGLCNLTGGLCTALPKGLEATFSETLAALSQQTRRSKEDPFAGLYGMPLLHGAANKLPVGLLLSAASHLYGSMSVGMTNVGSIDCRALQMGGAVPDAGWFGGPVKHKPGVQISAASFDGQCALGIWGYAADSDLPALYLLLDRMVEHICAFAQQHLS